jgi:hypothetical protein
MRGAIRGTKQVTHKRKVRRANVDSDRVVGGYKSRITLLENELKKVKAGREAEIEKRLTSEHVDQRIRDLDERLKRAQAVIKTKEHIINTQATEIEEYESQSVTQEERIEYLQNKVARLENPEKLFQVLLQQLKEIIEVEKQTDLVLCNRLAQIVQLVSGAGTFSMALMKDTKDGFPARLVPAAVYDVYEYLYQVFGPIPVHGGERLVELRKVLRDFLIRKYGEEQLEHEQLNSSLTWSGERRSERINELGSAKMEFQDRILQIKYTDFIVARAATAQQGTVPTVSWTQSAEVRMREEPAEEEVETFSRDDMDTRQVLRGGAPPTPMQDTRQFDDPAASPYFTSGSVPPTPNLWGTVCATPGPDST